MQKTLGQYTLAQHVVVDPRVAFGRPVLAGTGIPTAVLAERFKAGEEPQALADDYGVDAQAIAEAIRCEIELVSCAVSGGRVSR